jgi:short-subunit dehydrogenase
MQTPQVVVITGASAGIGEALALELGRAGHRLALAARRPDELERVAREAREAGAAAAISVPTDVTRREEVERLRDEALEAFGRIDVWVNNAGRGISKPVLQLTDADFDEMMTVNVKSALYGMQAVVPHFQERRAGHLINVSSFLGRVPLASVRSVYSAAKAALNSLTANLRTDLAAEYPEIHVSLVMPGIVKTGFARNALGASEGAAASPPFRPIGPMQPQTVEEVAAAIAGLLAEPRAEIYTNPASPALAQRYYADVAAFEAQAAALLRSGGPSGHEK